MPTPFTLMETDFEDLFTDAWIMGLDGGGDPCFSAPETKRLYQRGASVSAIDPLDLGDALVFYVGKMGTPFAPKKSSAMARRSPKPAAS